MKGIYLAACKARHTNYNIDYQDIDSRYKCNIGGRRVNNDGYNQGGSNVHAVIEKWPEVIHIGKENEKQD